jgi:hypothetical protein
MCVWLGHNYHLPCSAQLLLDNIGCNLPNRRERKLHGQQLLLGQPMAALAQQSTSLPGNESAYLKGLSHTRFSKFILFFKTKSEFFFISRC